MNELLIIGLNGIIIKDLFQIGLRRLHQCLVMLIRINLKKRCDTPLDTVKFINLSLQDNLLVENFIARPAIFLVNKGSLLRIIRYYALLFNNL